MVDNKCGTQQGNEKVVRQKARAGGDTRCLCNFALGVIAALLGLVKVIAQLHSLGTIGNLEVLDFGQHLAVGSLDVFLSLCRETVHQQLTVWVFGVEIADAEDKDRVCLATSLPPAWQRA